MRTADRRASASFRPEPVSAGEARRFLRGFLHAHGRDDMADAAGLALSEVVTNAVLHGHTPFDVTLSIHAEGGLRVEVTDRNPQLPTPTDYAEQATTGRGMGLIAAVTAHCGVDARGPDGKTVWFVVAEDDSGGGRSPGGVPGAWHVDLEAAEPVEGGTVVVLLGLPPTLWLAAGEHHDAILRELALFAQEHPGRSPAQERFALADKARGIVSARVAAELGRSTASAAAAHRALPAGHPSSLPDTPFELDLDVTVPSDAAEAFAAMQDVLDAAERLAVAGLLLARPGLPEVVAVRDWACEQIIAQTAGVLPARWPGTGQERFTVEVRDRDEPALPDWDMTVVAESERGVVAADDANRIIAVSRSLAHALGWDVDDLVGRRVVALIPPELREAHVAGFTRHLTTGETHAVGVPLQLPVLRADGTRVECRFLIEQTPATTGRPVYIAWIDPVA